MHANHCYVYRKSDGTWAARTPRDKNGEMYHARTRKQLERDLRRSGWSVGRAYVLDEPQQPKAKADRKISISLFITESEHSELRRKSAKAKLSMSRFVVRELKL